MTERHDLTRAVLAVTSGPACRRAEALLARRDHLPADEAALLAAHLKNCPDCRELAALLASLPGELAALADPPPDPGLTVAVLRRTLPLLRRRRCAGRPGVRAWLAAWWEERAERPTLAAEVALVAALLLAALGWLPGEKLPPRGRMTAVAARVVAPPARLGSLVADAAARLGGELDRLLDGVSRRSAARATASRRPAVASDADTCTGNADPGRSHRHRTGRRP